VKDRVGREVSERLTQDPELRRLLDRVVARKLDPASAADELFRTRYAAQ
jgi:hypothetical protein